MLNGSFARFSEMEIKRKALDGHVYEHDLEGESVKAIVQLDNKRGSINGLPIIAGMVIDHKMRSSNSLEEEGGKYHIRTEVSPKPVWANFQIIGNSIIRTNSYADMGIALGVLSHALGGNNDFAKIVNFDLQKMYKDYKGHWIGSIFDREGNMQRGTFYGKDIEKDDVIGTCWKKNKKSLLGFESDYFGGEPVKIRVTLEGGVLVFSNVTDESFLQFVLTELSPYMIEPPRTRRRRIF